jgi:hypothetical protein
MKANLAAGASQREVSHLSNGRPAFLVMLCERVSSISFDLRVSRLENKTSLDY